jgi:DNA-binding transcriptional MerR regulator
VWTIEELLDRVRAALAAEYPGAPNGRIRDVPDRRAVRWYATTGLVDRPAAMRGRTALYTQRHLLQLVSVKRRQAAGHSLAEIQAELAGATDATLAGIARVPDEVLTGGEPAARADPVRTRFWADTRTVTAAPPATPLTGIPLGHGVVLLVPGTPRDGDYAAITAGAGPLLDLLARRGLLATHHPAPTDGSSS